MPLRPDVEFERLYSTFSDESQQEQLLIGVYKTPLPGEYEYDRIHMFITPIGGETKGWIMTPSEAREIISGLGMAIDRAVKEGWDDARDGAEQQVVAGLPRRKARQGQNVQDLGG